VSVRQTSVAPKDDRPTTFVSSERHYIWLGSALSDLKQSVKNNAASAACASVDDEPFRLGYKT